MQRVVQLPDGHRLELPPESIAQPEAVATAAEARPTMQQLGLLVVLAGAAAVAALGRRRGPTTPVPTATTEPTTARWSLAVLLLVVLTAQVVHHAWPFYALDMFSYAPSGGSRLVVLQADGRAREPTRFVDFRCDAMPPDYARPGPEVCGTWNSIEVHDRRSFFWIQRHQGDPPATSATPLLLARRIERFDAEGGRTRVDCPITRCVARETP